MLLLIARLLLAAILTTAGMAKLLDRGGGREAMAGFGIPAVLAAPIGLLVPLAEIVVGVALVPTRSARWGALGALVLLVLFTVGIAVNLARGRRPACHCFGQLHSRPVGFTTLARNSGLAVMAGFVAWLGWDHPGASAVGWASGLSAAEGLGLFMGAVLAAAVTLQGWLIFNLLRQQGRLLLQIEALEETLGLGGQPLRPAGGRAGSPSGLPVGSRAPSFRLAGVHGEATTLEALQGGGKPILLLFTDPGCDPCMSLLPEIGRWQHEHGGELTVALISRGPMEANRVKAAEDGLARVLVQHDLEVAEAYRSPGTPSAVVVDTDGRIATATVAGAEAIRSLVAQTVGGPARLPVLHDHTGRNANGFHPPSELQLGQAAPDFRLPDLGGQPVRLVDFRGHATMLVFWNPGCGFCQRMLPDLKGWEADPPKGSPRLVLVSSGTVEANRQAGLQSRTLLDDRGSVMRHFGAAGTPMGVLVDREGSVASGLSVGAEAILGLLRTAVALDVGRPGQSGVPEREPRGAR
jgi:peroxiredoxin